MVGTLGRSYMRLVEKPIITNVLVQELHEKSQVAKPTAKGTPLRYSSSFGCSRQQGYAAFGAPASEPMDEAGAWVTGLGTIIHEALQDAISRRFPSAQFEVASQVGEVSGSCDALIDVYDVGTNYGGTHILYELKTMGTWSFDSQVGWSRMRGTFSKEGGKGPALKAITQAGMNALGIELENPKIRIETVVMGSITFEALSKQKASNMGIDGVNRFLAEYEIPRSEWEPLAMAELARMNSIASVVNQGYLPDRIALDDNGVAVELNPNSSAWQCEYCAFRTLCKQDGYGQVRVMDSEVSNE